MSISCEVIFRRSVRFEKPSDNQVGGDGGEGGSDHSKWIDKSVTIILAEDVVLSTGNRSPKTNNRFIIRRPDGGVEDTESGLVF